MSLEPARAWNSIEPGLRDALTRGSRGGVAVYVDVYTHGSTSAAADLERVLSACAGVEAALVGVDASLLGRNGATVESPTASFAPSRSPTTSQPSVSVAPTVDVYLRYDTKCDNKNLRHKYRRIVTLLATLTIAMLIATFIMGGVTLFRTKCIVHCCRKQKTEAYNTWTDPHSYYGRAKTSFMAYLAKFDHPNQPPPRPRPAAGGAMAHRGDDRETML